MVMLCDLMPGFPAIIRVPRGNTCTAKAAKKGRQERKGIELEKLDFDSNTRAAARRPPPLISASG